MSEFLSDEWFSTRPADAGGSAPRINYIVTGAGFDSTPIAANGRLGGGDVGLQKGHTKAAKLTVTLPFALAKAMLVDRDQATLLQGYLSGQITIDGDISVLAAAQPLTPAATEPEDANDALPPSNAEDHNAIAKQLLAAGWDEQPGVERWFAWPKGSARLELAKAAGTVLVVRLLPSAAVEIAYGDSLAEVLTRIDAQRATLTLETLDALYPAAKSIRYRTDDSGKWKNVTASKTRRRKKTT
jgi:hypothetical protein